ncbi:EF-P lysine aminoacylase EpmA [Kangiella sp. TOML190]|uniref:EF-P lysine aminoacylase EpmA n=1 Tax=Kangiella sp. TOML190 TaxID=2931351 RepID=UPI00203B6E78|nr:EF-P lysine aminoacylase EpmA [Kangiella sp. TOML190]
MSWKPTCSIQTLKARAELNSLIRNFFAGKKVLEVETPLLMEHGVTDRYMYSMRVDGVFKKAGEYQKGFLQSSPEYAMKRLLAAGSGSIYQICKAFRLEESGARHNPEFTMLEWYRVGFDHWDLMREVFELLLEVLGQRTRIDYSYQQVFERFLSFDPFTISLTELKNLSQNVLGELPADLEFDDYLSLLFEAKIEPHLGQANSITFIYDYPASQSSLARLDKDNPAVASRFEVYVDGFELANGFFELEDPKAQRNRFDVDNKWRQSNNLETIEIDQAFIRALEAGLPDCSGVALGLDRLLMIQQSIINIEEVLTFPIKR